VIHEDAHLAIGMMGTLSGNSLTAREKCQQDETFLALKGVVEQLAVSVHADCLSFRPAACAYCEEGTVVDVFVGDCRIGFIGLMRSDLRQERRMGVPVAIAEIQVVPVLANIFQTPVYQDIAQFPSTNRDMALVVDSGVTHGQIMQVIENNKPAELTGIVLFDIFDGEGLNEGQKSLGYSLTYQSLERTLKDEETNALHENLKSVLRRELDVTFREG
jgi:phenylalanyl-tRNA synthetase beta chain